MKTTYGAVRVTGGSFSVLVEGLLGEAWVKLGTIPRELLGEVIETLQKEQSKYERG